MKVRNWAADVALLLVSSGVCLGQTTGVPGHIVHCDPSCDAGTFLVHNNDAVTILKWKTSSLDNITFTYFQTKSGEFGALPTYYVAMGEPSRDPVEIGTYMLLSLGAAGCGVYMYRRNSKIGQRKQEPAPIGGPSES
jgi:hypothetical protein